MNHLFVGGGGGISQHQLSYKNNTSGNSYDAAASGVFLLAETGYELNLSMEEYRQIGFQFGFQLGTFIVYDDGYDETEISNKTNHRNIVNEGWNAAKHISRFIIGVFMRF